MPIRNGLPLVLFLISLGITLDSFAVELKAAAQNSAPKYYKSATNEMTGLCVDIMHAIERVDQTVRFKGYQEFTPFKRLQLQLESGEIDVFFGIKRTIKRTEHYKFITTPLYSLNYVVAAKKDDAVEVQDFDDIRELRSEGKVLTVLGSAANTFLRDQGGLLIDDGANSPSALLKMLKFQRGRFAFYHDLGLYHLVNKEGLADDIKILPASFSMYSHYVAFSKHVPIKVIDKISSALEQLTSTGELANIHKKYLVQR